MMWLVEVGLKSVITMEPAVLRSLAAMRPLMSVDIRLGCRKVKIVKQTDGPRHDEDGTTPSANPLGKDNSRRLAFNPGFARAA